MRIVNICMTCAFERPGDPSLLTLIEVRDDGLYTTKCSKGHVNATCRQENKFEILSELAVNSIIDGYYREAIASFTSSMERFFEFYLRVAWCAIGLGEDQIDSAWKTMAAQSERQLGAYIAVHLLQEGNLPPLLPPDDIKFRNNVIHKGYIPSRDEAIAFGNAVFKVVVPVVEMMRGKYEKPIQEALSARMAQLSKAARETGGKVSSMTIGTTFSLNRYSADLNKTTEEAIERVQKTRETLNQNIRH